MNKRPLLMMLVCFVLGEVAAMKQMMGWTLFLAAGTLLLVIWYVKTNGLQIVLLLFFCCILLGFMRFQMADADNILDRYYDGEQRTLTVTGKVCVIETAKDGSYYYYLGQVRYLEQPSFSSGKRVRVKVEQAGCLWGQTITVSGVASSPEHARNPGGFSMYQYCRGKNVDVLMQAEQVQVTDASYQRLRQCLWELRCSLAAQIRLLLPKEQAGFLEAILLGEKADLDSDLKKEYQEAGIAHVIAISGLHIGFFGAGLFALARKGKRSYLFSAVFSGTVIVLYGMMAGFSASLSRALLMLLLSFLARVIGRAYDMLSALSCAALLLLYQSPFQLCDAGFLLSFGAVFGIAVAALVGRELLGKGKGLLSSFVTTAAIQLATNPILCFFYFQLPLYSVLLNLIVIPSMSLLLPLSVAAVGVSLLSFQAGQVLMLFVRGILMLQQTLSYWSNRLPFSHFVTGKPSLLQIVIYYAGLAALWYLLKKRRFIKAAASFLLLLFLAILPALQPYLTITMLDVGQGDGLVLKKGAHVLLVDGGSSSEKQLYEYTYAPYLKSQGITAVDAVFLSHSDEDHISAVKELLENMPVGTIYLPQVDDFAEAFAALKTEAIRRGCRIRYVKRGDAMEWKGARLEVLHPDFSHTYEDVNEASEVLSLSYAGFSMLFTGDIGGQAEDELVAYMQKMGKGTYTILKCGHHGSKTSTSEALLAQVAPDIALISCGKRNRYGHPHKETIKRLQAANVPYFTTVEQGAISIKVNPKGAYELSGYRKDASISKEAMIK